MNESRDSQERPQNNIHWNSLEHLILVAGHAIYTASDFDHPTRDDSWVLQDFQRGEPPFYIEHIHVGVRMASDDLKSLLVFSGGQTRIEAGPRSEALSYWRLANHFSWWGRASVALRATTEEFARDSFENLLFGLCRFFECVGEYPIKVSVVGWIFKEDRFHLHREALRLPEWMFNYIGANNPLKMSDAIIGEKKAVDHFRKDPYGTGPDLGRKRRDRNPFNRNHPYEKSSPDLLNLLEHKGSEVFDGSLPWDDRVADR